MANLALEREQLDKSKKLFVAVVQRLMADGAQEDDMRIIHISLKLARISHLTKEYETAQLGYEWSLKKLNDAIKQDPTEDKIKLLAMAEDWYGRLFLDFNQNEHGLNFLISALKRMKETNIEEEHIVLQLNDIGTICEKLNKLDDSFNYFQEAITKGKSLNDMEDLEAIFVNMGKVCIRKKLLEEARKNCGYGWKLAINNKNDEAKKQAEQCLKEINSLNILRSKRAHEPLESRWSLSPIDTCSLGGITSTLSTSWYGTEYLMKGGMSELMERGSGLLELSLDKRQQQKLLLQACILSGCSSVAIGRLRSSPLGHPFSLVCYCVSVFLRAAFRSIGLRACMSVWGAAQCKSRGGS
ncbi:Tetratricopeptide repeat protein 19 homolog, mitochondrial [Eumeta japonica]|uniref:Tetratricopeptide repeat protein 19 homolog, mitochondrial n=1 Tax=Eumeta variegata TaxID=151549 RepID=A0A4C1TKJ3_EUMVA|nr:Tetratricopeptide repeat protein 19 homolog, mitochondrial [Eumeta japonica]